MEEYIRILYFDALKFDFRLKIANLILLNYLKS